MGGHGAARRRRRRPARAPARRRRRRRRRGRDLPAASARWSTRGAACWRGPPRRSSRRAIAELAFGLGPLEPLLADPAVEEVMVSGTRRLGRARRPAGAHRRAVRAARRSCATRSSGSWRRSAAASTRPSRCATPGCPTARASMSSLPPLALDGPALTIRRFRRRGFAREDLVANGHAAARAARPARARRAGALHAAGLRRHRLRQDDHAERAVDVRRRRRARSSRSRTRPSCGCASRTSCASRRGRPTSRAAAR